MRIALVSAFTPRPYNTSGPEALLYDLLLSAPADVALDLFVLDSNSGTFIRTDLPTSRNAPAAPQRNPRRPLLQRLKYGHAAKKLEGLDGRFDLVWCYPAWMYPAVAETFNGPILVSGMDSATLLFLRGCLVHKASFYLLGSFARLLQAVRFERSLSGRVLVHTVGELDQHFYTRLHGVRSFYSPHPYSSTVTSYEKHAWTNSGPLKLVFAGDLSRFYVASLLDSLVTAMEAEPWKSALEILFIGKGHEDRAQRLRHAGYQVTHVAWVADFAQGVRAAHIMVVPLAVGAGTKNRVLTALAAGLDCLGTDVAFENIAISTSNRLFRNADEFVSRINERLNAGATLPLSDAEWGAFAAIHSPAAAAQRFWRQAFRDLAIGS